MPLSEINNLNMSDNKENSSSLNKIPAQTTKFPTKKSAAVNKMSQELKALEVDEPLLKENPRRFVILPIQVPIF